MNGFPTVDLYEADRETLAALLEGEPSYRVDQVVGWLVRGVDDPEEMTDLPRRLRQRLAEATEPRPRVLTHTTADDQLTQKLLFEFGSSGGAEAVESVLMCYPPGDVDDSGGSEDQRQGRATVCVSTQAGCALGCPFCATGQAGFRRQLGTGEIVRQVTAMQRLLATGGVPRNDVPDHVTNVVFMGMGEPLANVERSLEAIKWLHGTFGLSARGITLSTVGVVPGMRRLTELGLPVTLAVSLHAPNDALRDDLVPLNRQWPLQAVLDAAIDYRVATGRRLTFEYILIGGVNAEAHHARELVELLRSLPAEAADAHVNLIPMNSTPAVGWGPPSRNEQHAFARTLRDAGITATIRDNRGNDIDAACGQLAADYQTGSGTRLPVAAGAAERLTARNST